MGVNWAERWGEELANEELTVELLPDPHASFAEIAAFAGTFDGYAFIGVEQLPPWSDALRAHVEHNGSLPRGLDSRTCAPRCSPRSAATSGRTRTPTPTPTSRTSTPSSARSAPR